MSGAHTLLTTEFGEAYAAEQLRRSRHPLRRLVKGFYLRNILRDVNGPTIDFGCGAGQLLACLPRGSVGIEVNAHLLLTLKEAGFAVRQARGEMSDFDLNDFAAGIFRCLVIAHVLEHLEDPTAALVRLLHASARLGIERVIVIVPGRRGYRSDRTHKTFIDQHWLAANPLPSRIGFAARLPAYFPGPEWFGVHFAFHEMKVIFDREPKGG